MDDTTENYRTSLANLTQNSKPLINMLTMHAEDNETHAAEIVKIIETHLQQVRVFNDFLYINKTHWILLYSVSTLSPENFEP